MSELRVDSVKSKGGGAPNLPKGVTISGIATAATLGATTVDVSNVNVSGVVTSGTLSGSLLSTGTPTLGLGVTINSSGVAISGVATAGIVSATTLYGDGTNLTGVGATIAPLFYQPDPGDTGVSFPAGIGITFNSQVKAGTGNVTLSIANAGVAGTVVENFGVGSSVTISENRITIDPTADLSVGQDYIISYPSGCFTNNEGSDYVGTAYTFQARVYDYQLWTWGDNEFGNLGQNSTVQYSSPVQLPGTNWGRYVAAEHQSYGVKTDGTLWGWGKNTSYGNLGQNNIINYSSPVQIPGTTWSSTLGKFDSGSYDDCIAIKTDGTLWTWGRNSYGQLGQNENDPSNGAANSRSSPVQVPGTTWSKCSMGANVSAATKTNGTLWMWGNSAHGVLGQNNNTAYSSPIQIPGTTWNNIDVSRTSMFATKTDGTLWSWGYNNGGHLGHNNTTAASSPIQIPGTTWSTLAHPNASTMLASTAIKTDGTLWIWGYNLVGVLGQNNTTSYSSPKQIPGTTWSTVSLTYGFGGATKTDGTLWTWGRNSYGNLGLNSIKSPSYHGYSSPVQIPGTTWHQYSAGSHNDVFAGAIKKV